MPRIGCENLFRIGLLLVIAVFSHSCADSNPTDSPQSDNFDVVGSYAAHYDHKTGKVRYEFIPKDSDQANPLGSHFALDYNDTTGISTCAINDTSKSSSEVNYCMGLVDPDNCSTDYNDTTHALSFYARMINKSNSTYYNDPNMTFKNGSADHDVTYLSPFHFRITGLDWTTFPARLIESVNTNLPDADCGGSGLDLDVDDGDDNERFDCIWPDEAYDVNDDGDPGWDFTPHITNGDMTPGEDTGCLLFMQYTLVENQSFTLYFDLLAVRDDGSLPSTPNVTSHSDGDYVNTNPITVSGDNCTAGNTVYVEGGASTASGTCTGGGTFSISTTLNANSTNNLSVYQIVPPKQSGSDSFSVIHDSIAPTVVASSPTDGQTSVSENANCVITFSEAMQTSLFTSTNLQIERVSSGADNTGTISASGDGTQAVIEPDPKPMANNKQFDCKALTGLQDLAGNALATAYTARFTTSKSNLNDETPPTVRYMIPADNDQDVSLSTAFTIQFDEAIDPDTIVGSVVDGDCDLDNEDVPTVFVFELNSCNPGGSNPIDGTVALSADGKSATFTPDDPADMEASNCYGFVVTSCVKDLAGNALPSRGERNIGAYNGGTITYNSYNVFFTGPAETDNPFIVHVGPELDVSDVAESVHPFLVFNEPITPSTIITDYFYMTEFGVPDHIPLTLNADPTLQVVTYKPTSTLQVSSPATKHVITATGAVTDLSGNQMSTPQTSQFDVNTSADSTAPTVLSVEANGAALTLSPTITQVQDKCPVFDIYFSEPMKESTLNESNIQVERVRNGDVSPVIFEIFNDGAHVRLIPLDSLNHGTGNRGEYDIKLSSSLQDRAGNFLGSDVSYSMEANQESTDPGVAGTVPANGESINQNSSVLIWFDEEMDISTITAANFANTGCGTPIMFASPDRKFAIANCINQMTTGGKSISISTDVRDYYNGSNRQSCENGSGNQIDLTGFSVSFTVNSGDDTTAPNVSTVTPSDGSTSVSTSIAPTITFSEAIDPRTILPSTIFLMAQDGTLVTSDLSVSIDARTITITPRSTLTGEFYYIVGTTAIQDLGGGNRYDGTGGESSELPGVLKTCFSTTSNSCP